MFGMAVNSLHLFAKIYVSTLPVLTLATRCPRSSVCCWQILSSWYLMSLCDLQGYDISFLITNYHCEEMFKHKLIDFVVSFMEVLLSYFAVSNCHCLPAQLSSHLLPFNYYCSLCSGVLGTGTGLFLWDVSRMLIMHCVLSRDQGI